MLLGSVASPCCGFAYPLCCCPGRGTGSDGVLGAPSSRIGAFPGPVCPVSLDLVSPSLGSYFASHFIMGGEKFDSAHPEGYLFGENSDLNFLGNRPVAVWLPRVLRVGVRPRPAGAGPVSVAWSELRGSWEAGGVLGGRGRLLWRSRVAGTRS